MPCYCATLSIPDHYRPIIDPHWSRAFTKLSQLIEHHPSAILFDSGTVDPTADSGKLEGNRTVIVPMETSALEKVVKEGGEAISAAVELAPP
jgi:hypothetical protein